MYRGRKIIATLDVTPLLTRGLLSCITALTVSILILSAGTNSFAQAGDEVPVKIVGSFWNVRSDGEHAVGYSADIWKRGNKLLGLVSVHAGLVGDPPTGTIENVKFDPVSKRISFTAKLTLGVYSDKTHDSIPSRDTLTFSGYLYKNTLKGTVSLRNELCSGKCVEREKVTLPLLRSRTRDIGSFANLAAWNAYTAPTLEMLGPKW